MISGVSLIDSVVSARGLSGKFSSSLTQEAARAAKNAAADSSREDFRKLDLITIDGEDARDFDDAVFCTTTPNGGFRLRVAIADVAAFVLPDSPLDTEAGRRGTSVYLPDRVLPMLPSALSDDACSLNPDEDKLCLLCEMEVSPDGETGKYRFARGIMRSKRRMTYDEAAREMRDKSAHLQPLARLGEILRARRRENGAFMIERPEMCAVLSAGGKVEMRTIHRNEAHMMIEECMIAANRCAADFVIRRRLPALHRIHKKPSADNIRMLRGVLSPLGVSFPARPAAADFGKAMDAVAAKDPALADCILPLVLGALSRAEYAPDEKTGHFGLSCKRYLHWTSPIRRYPDLLAHRAIIAGIAGEKFRAPDLTAVGAHCSQTEVIADKAGWECRQKLLCLNAQDNVGKEYEVVVSGASSFGLFVVAPELGLDGMLRLSSLPGYWSMDADNRRATRRKDGKILALGARLQARLSSVLAEKGRANFSATSIDGATA